MAVWLKALGTTEHPLADDWSVFAPWLRSTAPFARKPGSIIAGDKIVYYASGHRRVLAIAEVVSMPYEAGEKREQGRYLCNVRILTMRPFLHDTPSIEQVIVTRDLKQVIRRRSHIRLEDEEYAHVVAAFTAPLHCPVEVDTT